MGLKGSRVVHRGVEGAKGRRGVQGGGAEGCRGGGQRVQRGAEGCKGYRGVQRGINLDTISRS